MMKIEHRFNELNTPKRQITQFKSFMYVKNKSGKRQLAVLLHRFNILKTNLLR